MKRMPVYSGFIVYLLLFTAISSSYAAKTAEMLPMEEGDFAASNLFEFNKAPLLNQSKADIAVSWPIKRVTGANKHKKPYTSRSKAFWKPVSASQLQRGISITTTAPGAVVRMSPVTAGIENPVSVPALDINSFEILDAQGLRYRLADKVTNAASFEQLEGLRLGFVPGTLVFKLDDDLGSGEFKLIAQTPVKGLEKIVVYVFDKSSDIVLTMQMLSDIVFGGDTVVARLELAGGFDQLLADKMHAYLSGPSGQRIDMNIDAVSKTMIEARAPMHKFSEEDIGIWDVHAKVNAVVENREVQRNVRNMIAINLPGAALKRKVDIDASDSALKLSFGIESESPGRYEIRGTLYAKDKDGERVPVIYANSAGWREQGESVMDLVFDLSELDAGYSPPYELNNLKFYDQSRMMLLHKQNRAIRIIN